MQRGQARAARDHLERALAEDPDSAFAHALIALCYVDLGNRDAASDHAARARALEPNEPMALHAAAAAQMLRGRLRDAEKTYLELIALEPNDAQPHRALADLYRVAGADDWTRRAEPLLERALELEPDDLGTRVSLATLELARGRIERAGLHAREALQSEPEHAGALVVMGRVELEMGDVEAARELAVQALRTDPDSRSALELLVSVKARSSRWLAPWWRLQSRLSMASTTTQGALAVGAFGIYVCGVWLASGDPAWTRAAHATFWGLLLYALVGNALFEGSVSRETKDVELRGDF